MPRMADSPSPAAPAERPPRDGLGVAQRLLTTVMVLALVGTVLALVLVQRVGVTYTSGLEIAADGADVAAVSVREASGLVDEIAGLAEAVSVALDQAETVLNSSADALDGIGEAMGDNIADGLEATAEIANGLAGFIETIERFIPGNSDSLAESLRKLSDGLEPTPDQLRDLATQLAATADELRATAVSLQPIGNQVDTLAASVSNSQSTLAEVERLAQQVQVRSEEALDRSSRDLLLLRLLVIVVGVGVAAACWAASRAVRTLQRA